MVEDKNINPQQFVKAYDKRLQQEFKGRISNTHFLTSMLQDVLSRLGKNLERFFPMPPLEDVLITAVFSAPYYDICRMILGVHRSETFNLLPEQEKATRMNPDYREELVQTVLSMIFLKEHASDLYRRRQLIMGEEWLYYPLPYFLYAFNTSLLKSLPPKLPELNYSFEHVYFVNIMRKAISALTILDTTFYENAYPICRSMIEEYIKLTILRNNPQAFRLFYDFSEWEFQYNKGVDLPEEFENLCNEHGANKNRIQFLNYGWVEGISDYRDNVKDKPYTFFGLYTYCKEKKLVPFDIEILYKLYNQCHSYVHANARVYTTPQIHYIEISLIVYFTTRFYAEDLFKDYKLADVNIYTELDKWANKAVEKYDEMFQKTAETDS